MLEVFKTHTQDIHGNGKLLCWDSQILTTKPMELDQHDIVHTDAIIYSIRERVYHKGKHGYNDQSFFYPSSTASSLQMHIHFVNMYGYITF